MFSPNRRRPHSPQGKRGLEMPKTMDRETKRRLWTTVVLTLILFVLWYGCIAVGEAKRMDVLVYGVMVAYFLVFAVLLISYLVYNRGFVNKDVTEEMLPSDWSEEKKQAFLTAQKTRAEKSRWMLTVIIPFVIVFFCETLYLFVWDGFLADFFKG